MPTSFASLPGEVRNMVYCSLFAKVLLVIPALGARGYFEKGNRSLLMVSRMIRQEALACFYHNLFIEMPSCFLPGTSGLNYLPYKDLLLDALQHAKTIVISGGFDPEHDYGKCFKSCRALRELNFPVGARTVYNPAFTGPDIRKELRHEGNMVIEGYLEDCMSRLERNSGLEGRVKGFKRASVWRNRKLQPNGSVSYWQISWFSLDIRAPQSDSVENGDREPAVKGYLETLLSEAPAATRSHPTPREETQVRPAVEPKSDIANLAEVSFCVVDLDPKRSQHQALGIYLPDMSSTKIPAPKAG